LLCRQSDYIFDVGSNTGIYALVAKAARPDAHVFAFEPVERVYKKLRQNIDINGFYIHSYQTAISNATGTAHIYDTNTEHTLSVAVNKDVNVTSDKTFKVEIETITLDDFIDSNKLPKVDLLKLDVETHEVEALEGFKKYLHAYKPDMLIEILDDKVAKGIGEIINGLGYRYFNIDENKGIKEVSELGKSDYYNFLICSEATADKIRKAFRVAVAQ
jgi:FkbM family methyltransferase